MDRRRFARTAIVALLLLYGWAGPLEAAEQILTITSQSGAKMRTLLSGDPSAAKANLILLAGGDGKLIISGKGEVKRMKKNFLVRTRAMFTDAGFLAAVADAPMDRRGPDGLLGGFRASAEHAADLAKLAGELKQLNDKPVIAVGTSRGTISAANLAALNPDNAIKAVVLSSSLVKRNEKGAALSDLPLDAIKIPVLFLHNVNDGCKYTQPKDVKEIAQRMMRSGADVDVIEVTSDKETSKPCQAMSRHGFLGIERLAVNKIADWIARKL